MPLSKANNKATSELFLPEEGPTLGVPPPSEHASAVALLVDSLRRQEEPVVHVALGAKVESMTLKGLDVECFPQSVPTDKLASLRAKAIKKGIQKPFPFVDVVDFLPPWAQEARVVAFVHARLGFVCGWLLLQAPDQVAPAEVKAKRVDMIKWMSAIEVWALAVDATEVLRCIGGLLILRGFVNG